MLPAEFICNDFKTRGFGLPIAEDNKLYKPKSREPYIALRVFDGGGTSSFTMATQDQDVLILQAIVSYPANTGLAAVNAKTEEILNSYSFNVDLTDVSGDITMFLRSKRFFVSSESGQAWYQKVLRLTFNAIIRRQ